MNCHGPERTAADRGRRDTVPEVTDKSRNTAVDFATDLITTNWIGYRFRSSDTFVSFLCRQLPYYDIRAVAVRGREINER